MELRNFTPFVPLCFESRDHNQIDFGVAVLRGTFELVPDKPLRPLQEQEPLVMVDEYHGGEGQGGLRMENNIAPFKPSTDIHIDADAHSRDGKPRPRWRVGITVGELNRTLTVTGPRAWKRGFLGGWSLTDPVPAATVPLRYEYAYGGTKRLQTGIEPYRQNPIGRGFINPQQQSDPAFVFAPQIVADHQPDPDFGERCETKGFAPVPPAWSPRLERAGTFDRAWQTTRWPDLPADFDYAFYNSAHPDLIYPGFVQGNEAVRFHNLHPHSTLNARLPGYQLGLLLRREDGQLLALPMNLDTLHFDLHRLRAYLVWRGVYALEPAPRVLEIRIQVPDNGEA